MAVLFYPTILFAAACAISGMAHAATDADLREVVAKRLDGDRTGACFAAAVIERDTVSRAYVCADGKDPAPRIDADTAFEIGSVSKTMTASLLAGLIREGKASLDDPLSAYLLEGSTVPMFEGKPILLRHVVSHSSGLPAVPPVMASANMLDPYAAIDGKALLDGLSKTTLTRLPGSKFEYSNFAMMLLSYAVARRAGADFETLLYQRLFKPLGMKGAYVVRKPDGVKAAVGHMSNGRVTPAWHFGADLAGVGGVRATLDDMVRYVQAQMGTAPDPLRADFARAHALVATIDGVPMAMNWMALPLKSRTYLSHGGDTGGFGAFIAFDAETRRGVVVLSDTAMHAFAGTTNLAMHLLDATVPLDKPRRVAAPPSTLLDALVGEYQLEGAMKMSVRRKGDALEIQAQGQPAFAMGYDDRGDFYPLAFDAMLRPQRRADGSMAFVWSQLGGNMPARRLDATAAPALILSDEDLQAYPGKYPLMPGFALTVRVEGDSLTAQATGQGRFPLGAVSKDVFEAPQYGIVIRFQRDAAGKVGALKLEQGGHTLEGKRE